MTNTFANITPNSKPIRVLMSGGGTGGHIFPAIAIADEIKKDFPMRSSSLSVPKEKWKWKKFLSRATTSSD